MKNFKIAVCILLVCSSCEYAHAQLNPMADSSLPDRIHKMSLVYSLSGSQEKSFLALEIKHRYSLDSLGKLNLNPERRKQWLTAHEIWHNQQLRNLFSDEQWQKFQAIRTQRTQQFMEYANKKKITVVPIVSNGQ